MRPLILTLGLLLNAGASADVVVGSVSDGPEVRPMIPLALIQLEVAELTKDEFEVSFPPGKALDGNWTQAGVRQALLAQLNDPEVDIVLATGVVASHEAAKFPNLPKPVIATTVADVELQAFPSDGAGSGRKNFVYLSNLRGVETDLATFRSVVEFEHLAVLVDQVIHDSIPELVSAKPKSFEQQLGIRATPVPVGDSALAALSALPVDTDAVYVTPLMQLSSEQMQVLAQGLIERGIPSFSLLGRRELGFGFLLAASGREGDDVRIARRVALDIQRILLGELAESISVNFRETQRLAINMRTATALNFTPRYAVLADAEQLFDDSKADEPVLTLAGAMAMALDNNLNLAVARFNPAIAVQDMVNARSALLPQLGLSLETTRIDQDRASPFIQSQRSTGLNVNASQVIYSAEAWAGYRVAGYLASAEDDLLQEVILDTLAQASKAYLGVLRARALEAVQRSNLEVTRENLELAQVRESIGFSGRTDVLRWESQIASDRQNLITSEASNRAVVTDLNRILHRPQNLGFNAPEDDLARSIAVFEDPRFRIFIDNAATWELFQDFLVQRAVQDSPQLSRINLLLQAQQTQLTAARRSYYLPELSLSAGGGSVLSRGGAGSDLTGTGLDNESWNIGLFGQWPLFTSGALRSKVNQAQLGFRQLERQHAALAEQIEASVRIALHRTSGSYPALELSADAASAAGESLGLVTDAYSKGAVSVTDLIDAQNAALAAGLSAAEARYAYLLDLVDVLRGTSDFSLLLDTAASEAWYGEVEAYLKERGNVPRQ